MTDLTLITEPTVHLIGRTNLDLNAVDNFLDGQRWAHTSTESTELISELAGRCCYLSFGEKQGRRSTEAYLQNIVEQAHGRVLEHALWNFIITGVSRSFSHELVRHRAGVAVSQLSQRYVDESDTAFVVPPLIQEMLEANPSGAAIVRTLFEETVALALQAYEGLTLELQEYLLTARPELDRTMRRKKAREAARCVLPNATETVIVFSANTRALRHIIELQGSEHADAEMQRVAKALLACVQQVAPSLFGDFLVNEQGGIETAYSKV